MITTKKIRLSNGLRIKASRHFQYGLFGVRGRYETNARSGAFISSLQPGTGFFTHDLDSHSYRNFVHDEKRKIKQSLFTLLLGKEPSFDKEIARVEKAFEKGGLDEVHTQVLSCYFSVLRLAKEEEINQRVVRGVKDKMGHRHTGKTSFYTSILSNYKSRIATLQHDVRGAQFNIKDSLSKEALECWSKVVEAFRELVEVRRLWEVVDGESYEQVWFDFGIFDYIQSPFDTPMMRDSKGGLYFLYPQGVVRYRSNVDFDFVPLQSLDFEASILDLNTLSSANMVASVSRRSRQKHSDALSKLYATISKGRMSVGQMHCPQLGLTVCCNHLEPVDHFVKAFYAFKNLGLDLTVSTMHASPQQDDINEIELRQQQRDERRHF